jgi:hypothetical protein
MIEKTRVVEIRKGGELFYTDWEDGEWIETNVTETINNHLFDPCYFADDLILKDIFDVVEPNIDLFKIMMPYEQIDKIITESKTACSPENNEKQDISLLLGWCVEHEKEFKELAVHTTFDGVTHEDREQEIEGDIGNGRIGLDFLPANHLIDCEIRQNTRFDVWGGIGYGIEVSKEPLMRLDCKSFTLLEVIYGIFFELSFHGPPRERERRGNELVETIKKAEADMAEGRLKSMTMEEFEDKYKDLLGEDE